MSGVQDIFDECQVNRGSFKGPIPNPHSGLPRYWLFTTRRVIVYLLVVLQSGTSVSCRYSVMTSKDDEAAEREEVSKVVKLQNTLLLILQQRLKSALWYSIGQFVDDALLSDDLNATPQFIGALTELVYTQIGISHYYCSFGGAPPFAMHH